MDSFVSEMMVGVETPEPPKTPEAPSPPEKPEDTTKPPAKPDAPKPDPKAPAKPDAKTPAKPDKAPADKPDMNMNQLRRRHDELLANEKKTKAEIAKLQEENRALTGKKYVTPEMEAEIKENKEEIARLKAQVAEAAYEHSDEFKSKYVEPWQRTLQSTLAMVDQMSTPADEDNGIQSRKTTSADFQRVFSAPVGEQAEMAQKIFGTNALRILTQIDKLNELKQQADASVKAQREGLDGKRKQFEEFQKVEFAKYRQLRDSARDELVQKYPQFFGPDDTDPEASEALASGFAFVDKASDNADDLSVDERAAYAEVIRARAAWFPRGFRQLTKAQEKIKSLEEELAKYRESDPGAGKETGDVKPKEEEFGKGIAGLAEQIEKAME